MLNGGRRGRVVVIRLCRKTHRNSSQQTERNKRKTRTAKGIPRHSFSFERVPPPRGGGRRVCGTRLGVLVKHEHDVNTCLLLRADEGCVNSGRLPGTTRADPQTERARAPSGSAIAPWYL